MNVKHKKGELSPVEKAERKYLQALKEKEKEAKKAKKQKAKEKKKK